MVRLLGHIPLDGIRSLSIIKDFPPTFPQSDSLEVSKWSWRVLELVLSAAFSNARPKKLGHYREKKKTSFTRYQIIVAGVNNISISMITEWLPQEVESHFQISSQTKQLFTAEKCGSGLTSSCQMFQTLVGCPPGGRCPSPHLWEPP